MAKYKKALLEDMTDWIAQNGLMERGGAKLFQFVKHFGISDQTYRNWLDEKPEFGKAIEEGRAMFVKNSANVLIKSLFETAKGGYHEETSETEETRYIPNPTDGTKPTIKEMVKKKTKTNKWSAPNTAAAIFLLTNLDPENWVNRQRNDIALKKAEAEDAMSLDAIEAELSRLDKLDKSDNTELKQDKEG